MKSKTYIFKEMLLDTHEHLKMQVSIIQQIYFSVSRWTPSPLTDEATWYGRLIVFVVNTWLQILIL